MEKKIIDLTSYKIEKTLRDDGFDVKKDTQKKVKLIIKINKQ